MAQVGEIVYQVQMDVAQLLTSQRQLDQRLRNMEGGFNRTTTAVNGTERSMASLSRVAASLTAYLSVSAVTSYAEAWTVLNNKLVNSIKAGETLAVVNQRVFDIAQNSRSSLDGIATLYSRLERAMRSAGLSGEELGQITTTISKAMTVSGATAAESEGALVQLSQALASGVLRGQEFNSMSEQAPALMKGLADSLGVSIGKLRSMAAEGKLTTDVLLKAFREMGPTIEAEFANTTQTMSQSLQVAGNNITKFFGENTTVKTFISLFNDATISVSNNLESLTNVLLIAAGVMGSRYVGALTLAGAAQAKKVKETFASMSATKLAARAEIEATTATISRIAAEKAMSVTVQQSLIAQLAAARTEEQRTRIRRELAVNSAVITGLTQQETAATNNLAAAQGRLNIASGMASKALSLIGGPVGAAMLAGAAVYYFFQKSEEAKRSAHDFADSLNDLRGSMDKMSRVELTAKIADAKDKLDTLTDAQHDAEKTVKDMKTAYEGYANGAMILGNRQEYLEEISRKLARAEESLERVQKDRSKTTNFIEAAQAKLNGTLLQGEDLLKREAGTILPNAAFAWKSYGLDIEGATRAKQKFNAESLKVQWSDAGADMKKTLEREIEMAGAKDDVVKRQLQVKYYIEDKGISGQEAEKLDELAVKAGEASEAKKTGIKTSREAVAEAKKEATEAEKLKQKITDLANATKVAELETKGLSREAAVLEAVQKLGSKANTTQIAEVTELAGKEFDLTQKIKDRKEAFEQNPRAKADQSLKLGNEQLERQLEGNLVTEEQYQQRRAAIYADYSRKISEETSNGQVNIVSENRAKIDPVQALANENAQKLALMTSYQNAEQALLMKSYQDGRLSYDQYIAAKQGTDAQYLALKTAQDKQYQEQQTAAQWELLSQQGLGYEMLTSAIDSFAGNASNVLTGLMTGTMSAADAMRSLGNTILNSVVNAIVQVGVDMLKNFILTQTLGKAAETANAASAIAGGAAAAAAWTPAAIAASIATGGVASATGLKAYTAAQLAGSALGIAGARKNGGDVRGGSAYEIGEGNLPELMQIGNKLIAIPGNNGRVFSYDDVTGAATIPKASTGPRSSKAKESSPDVNNYQGGIGNLTVVIENHGSPTTIAGQRMEKGLTEGDVLRIIMQDAHDKGPGLQAIMANTTAGPRLRG